MDARLNLAYGRHTYPDEVRAVWGARLIWPNDFVHDRQDLAALDEAAKQDLITWLNEGAIRAMREALESPYSLGLSPTTDDEAVIYEDEIGRIVGSAQGSHGYVYVAGWLHDDSAQEVAAQEAVKADPPMPWTADRL